MENFSEFENVVASSLTSNDQTRRAQAEAFIVNKIYEDPLFFNFLLDYCIQSQQTLYIQMALILLQQIIVKQPNYIFQQNFELFDVKFEQFFFQSISNQIILPENPVRIIRSVYAINPEWPFYRKCFFLFRENLCFFPVSLILIQFKDNPPDVLSQFYQLGSEISQIFYSYLLRTSIQTTCDNRGEFFGLNKKYIKFVNMLFCSIIMNKESEELAQFQLIIENLYTIAIHSLEIFVDEIDFCNFWASLLRINSNMKQKFYEVAIGYLFSEALLNATNVQRTLLTFLGSCKMFILPQHVSTLIEILFRIQIIDEDDSLLSFFDSLVQVNFDSFGYAYERIKDYANLPFFQISIILTLISIFPHRFTIQRIGEVLGFCHNLIFDGHIPPNQFSQIFEVISRVSILPEAEFLIEKIVELLFSIILLYSRDKYVVTYCFFILSNQNFLDRDPTKVFFRLLKYDILYYFPKPGQVAKYYFKCLQNFIPSGRLFPESLFDPIKGMIMNYISNSNNNIPMSTVVQAAIFGFSMYLTDPGYYHDILHHIIDILLAAHINCSKDRQTMNDAAAAICKYIEIFKEESLDYLNSKDYYSSLLSQTVNIDEKKNVPRIVNISNANVLSLICQLDKDHFENRNIFFNAMYVSIFIDHSIFYQNNNKNKNDDNNYQVEVLLSSATLFFWKAKSPRFFVCLRNNFLSYLQKSFDSANAGTVSELFIFAESLINPKHIDNAECIGYREFAYSFINDIEKFLYSRVKLETLEVTPQLFDGINQGMIALVRHNRPMVHIYFDFVLQIISNNTLKLENPFHFHDSFYQFVYKMLKHHVATEEEVEKFVCLIAGYIELVESKEDIAYMKINHIVYFPVSYLILYSPKYCIPLVQKLIHKWQCLVSSSSSLNSTNTNSSFQSNNVLEGNVEEIEGESSGEMEMTMPILATVFMMLFGEMPGLFESNSVFEMMRQILERFKLNQMNCKMFLLSSLKFLKNYPNIPPDISTMIMKQYILYLSYLKYASYIFNIGDELHQSIIGFLKGNLNESNELLFKSCFVGAPRALQQALDILRS